MFTLFGNGHQQDCQRISRRELLRVGALGVGGLTLSQLLHARAAAAESGSSISNKSVVVLFLQGGPTHIETFDPKMTAPAEYRAMFGEVKTALPGVTFGSHFPKLAALAERMAIVRGFRHGISNHQSASEHVISGGNPLKATMGSLYARIAGISNPTSGIPNNTVIAPPAAGKKYKSLGAQTSRVTNVGSLPAAYKAFDPSSGGQILKNMQLSLPQERLDDRRNLLKQLDRLRARVDGGLLAAADRFQQQAFEVILGGVAKAFDLSTEDAATLARYDTGMYEIPAKLKKKKSNVPRQSPIALGRQMLMARKLVEAGCGFVTVTSAGWDMHGNAFGINDGMPLLGPAVDKAASAFIEDLIVRGLYDDTLLIITGEFGRTPRINKKAGRDHWGNLCTLALAGGGLRMGQVIGSSNRTASVPASDPVTSNMLMGTIMHTLFDVGRLRLDQGVPADIRRVIDSAQPIPQLV